MSNIVKTSERNINNNPSGKPFCCFIGCNEYATLDIQNPPPNPGDNPADYSTQSCGDHVLDLADIGAFVSRVESRTVAVLDDYSAEEEVELSVRLAVDDEVVTGAIMLFSSKSGKWAYSPIDGDSPCATDYESFVCGFASKDAAIDHANAAAYEAASDPGEPD